MMRKFLLPVMAAFAAFGTVAVLNASAEDEAAPRPITTVAAVS